MANSVDTNPDGFTPRSADIHATSGNVAAGAAVATLPAILNKTNYITGIEITGGGATAASLVIATLAGLKGAATKSFILGVLAGAAVPNAPLVVEFNPPLRCDPATAATLTVPSLGTGNLNSCANISGYAA